MVKIMTVRAPEDLQTWLSENAQKMGITRNSLILHILWEWKQEKAEDCKISKT